MSTTPSPSLAERLQAHHEAGYLSLHMPGHKENTALAPYLACLRADLDITELPDFDDLHDPSGVLAQAMDRAAALWDSRRSYLQVNGSTGGLLAAIRTDLGRIFDRLGRHPPGRQGPGGPPLPQGSLSRHRAVRPGAGLSGAAGGTHLRHRRLPPPGAGGRSPGGAPRRRAGDLPQPHL